MAFKVLTKYLPALMEQLKPDMIPRATNMLGVLHQAIEGKIKATFYTDKWPNVSAVVCQVYSPRVSDVADLMCYTTCNEAALQVLTEGKLITWGQRQLFFNFEVGLADFLSENLVPPPNVNARIEYNIKTARLYYLPVDAELEGRLCPSGYVLGKLEPHHAEYVASHWSYLKDWPNRVSWFEERIKNFDSAAIFSTEDNSLVSWIMRYPGREQGGLFTLEDHREKGLASVVKTSLCLSSKSNKTIPHISFTDKDNPNNELLMKLGFKSTEFQVVSANIVNNNS